MIIGVISAKGGVGKTTLVSNVGAALVKEFKKSVLLIDGNVTIPTLGIHFGILPQEKTLDDILNGDSTFDQTIYIHPSGVDMVLGSLDLKTEYPDPTALKEKLSQIKDQYDIILIDGAAGIGREVISTIQASDHVLIVTNPDMTSVAAALKAIKISNFLNVPVLGIALNKVTKEKYELNVPDTEEICETKVISTIPFDKKIAESIKNMTPIVLSDEKTTSSIAFKTLAAHLIGEEYYRETFWDKLKRIFKLKS
jgi:septum site-determining protein MinD